MAGAGKGVFLLLGIAGLLMFAYCGIVGMARSFPMNINPAKIIVGSLENSHAETKHGADAILANDCFNQFGAALRYTKTENPFRKVELCVDENDFMAVRILDKKGGKWYEITKYVDRNFKNFFDALNYAENEMGDQVMFDYIAPEYQGIVDPGLVVP